MPVFIKASPKLSRNPSLYPVRRKYVWSCFLCTRVTCSTDLSSRTTFPSTTISARNASSNFMPRNSIEIGTYRSTRSPRCRNSCAKITSYTVSSSPGPNSRWMVTAESTTTFPISFSVTPWRPLRLCASHGFSDSAVQISTRQFQISLLRSSPWPPAFGSALPAG